jgi:hypothetical protein
VVVAPLAIFAAGEARCRQELAHARRQGGIILMPDVARKRRAPFLALEGMS